MDTMRLKPSVNTMRRSCDSTSARGFLEIGGVVAAMTIILHDGNAETHAFGLFEELAHEMSPYLVL